MKKIILLLIIMVLLAAPAVVLAKGLNDALGNLDASVKDVGLEKELSTSIGTVVKAALALVGTIFLILTVYAGILWMTAQGNDEKVEKAKKIITACIIGLFITMSAYAVTYFVTTKLGGSSPGSSGGAGCCVTSQTGVTTFETNVTTNECQSGQGFTAVWVANSSLCK